MAKRKETRAPSRPGKGKGRTGATRVAGSAAPATPSVTEYLKSLPVADWLPETIVAAISAAITVYMLLGYCAWMSVLVAPVLAGLITGLIVSRVVFSAGAGALGGLVGGLVANHDYSVETLQPLIENMPRYANLDVVGTQLYKLFLVPLLQGGAVISGPGGGAAVALALFLTPVVAAGTSWAVRTLPAEARTKDVLGWFVVVALGAVLIGTSWQYAGTFRGKLGERLTRGGFAFDGYVYRDAYEYMLEGNGYYASLLKAGADDKRLIEGNVVHDGKFHGFISSPVLAREPLTFYFWRVFAPTGSQGVLLLALLACAGTLAVVHWGLKQTSLAASLLAPVLLYPMFMLQSAWANIFMPDFWAGLAMLVSLSLLIRKQLIGAIAVALIAALFRETLVFWLGALLVYSALRVKSSPGGRRDLIVAASSTVVFAALYALHFYQAGQIIAEQVNTGAGGFIARLQASAATPVEVRFLSPLSYMMWPYGFFRFPGAWVAAAGVVGWAMTFGRQHALRWVIVAYAAFWMLYYATVGAASGYWGQQVLPFYLVGLALLLAPVGADDQVEAA